MKKLFLLVSVVFAMFAFASCSGDEAEVNQMVFDGVAYDVTPHLTVFDSRYFLSAEGNQVSMRCDLHDANLGKSYDLTKQNVSDDFSIMMTFAETYINMENHPDFFAGCVGDNNYENESPFKSGEMTFAKDGDNYTFVIRNAEFKNGQKVSVNLELTPEDMIEENPE